MKPTKKLESELRNDYEAENLQLRDEVKRQAIELERKNRELNIESALERVRARTMAMHHSEELKEIITVLLKELKELGMAMENRSAIIFVVEHGQRLMTQWVVSRFQPLATGIRTPYYDNPILADFWEAWEMKTEFYEKSYSKKEKNTLFSYFFNELGFEMPEESRELIFQIPHYSLAVAIEKNSSVALASHTKEKLTTGEADLLKRFAAVFEQAYIRFLDLQKAEAQAREAQIEAALEKIRSTSLAMQRSSEIDKVANVLYEKLKELGLEFDGGAAIILFTEGSMDANIGVVSPLTPPTFHRLPWDEDALADNPIMVDEWKAKDEKIDIINKFYSFEQKNRYFQYVFKHNGEDKLPVTVREFILNTKSYTATFIAEKNSLVGVNSWTEQLLSEADIIVLRRIARVFEQAYIRFLDLQKAEAQAREAQIETALERVRARAMAMYTSEELMEVVKELRKQVGLLGQPELTTCVIQLYDESPDYIYSWVSMQASESDRENIDFRQAPVPKKGLLIQEEALEAYLSGGKDYTLLNEKGKLKQWVGFIKETYPEAYEAFVATVKDPEHVPAYWSFSDFTGGSLLMVTMAPPTRESKEMLRRFANVFGLAYRRFVDLKQAEARAREAQIEASMERVRSRTMAMHKSAELGEVAVLLYSELMALGVTQQFFECGYVEVDEVNKIQRAWMTKPDGGLVEPFNLPLIGEPVFDARYEAWKQRVPVFHQAVGGDQLRRHLEFAIPYFGSKEVEEIARTQVPDAIIFYCANFSHGYLSIASGTILSVEAESLLARFTRVFEMTYKRFVDLQNAEAQAREAQIQLALERVRARTMAMNKSDELAETAQLLYHEFGTLGLPTYTCGYMFVNEQTMTQSIWAVKPDGSLLRDISTLPLTGNPVLDERYSDWKAQKPLHIRCVEGEENKEHHRFLKEHAGPGFAENFFSHTPERLVFYCANFSKGYLAILARDYLPKEAEDIIIRFSRAFDQTYTRFLDLQNAEAQARESQIQLALERVRARTMAMQKSSELADVATILFQQVKALGIPQWVCGFSIWEIGDTEFTWYPGSPDGNILTPCKVPLNEHPVFISFDESRRRGDELFVYEKEGEFQAGHYRYMMTIPGMRELLQNMLDAGLSFPTFQIDHLANFSHGNLVFITYEHFPEMHDVFKRFAKVFDQTYTRFLDLQTAETQARESQIQLALERVRARTMAMQHSEELGDAATIMFHQLKQLGINLWAATFDIWKPGDPWAMEYAAGPDGRFFKPFRNPIDYNDPFVKYALEERKMGKELIEINLSGPALAEANKRLLTQPETREVFESIVRAGYKFPEIQFNYFAFFSHGFLQFISTERYPESQDIFIRMAKVFEQTYTRFLDLQKAEAQARESQIQLALERVRARTMAMQKSEELREVTIVLYDQLKDLGFKYGIVSITLMDVATGDMDWWLEGLKDGFRFLERYHVNYFDHKSHIEQLDYWKKGTSFATIIVSGEDKKAFDNVYFNQSDFKRIPDETKARMMGQETVVFSMAYMLYGALSWSSPGIIADEQAEILQRFAKVFEQTYTRFLDLQKAEAQAREAQIEAALEKVRAKVMAMQVSNDLNETSLVFGEQLRKLGIDWQFSYFWLIEEDKDNHTFWITWPDKKTSTTSYSLAEADESFQGCIIAWRQQTKIHSTQVPLEDVPAWIDTFERITNNAGGIAPQIMTPSNFRDGVYYYDAMMKFGSFGILMNRPVTEEEKNIQVRFAVEFERAYTRFLDLQKAEAQVREAKIEAGLERVRARTMAMHKSEELAETAAVVFKQLINLGIEPNRLYIAIINDDSGDLEFWITDEDGNKVSSRYVVNIHKNISIRKMYEGWKEKKKTLIVDMQGEELMQWLIYWNKEFGIPFKEGAGKQRRVQNISYFSYGFIAIASWVDQPEETISLLDRFAAVFNLTYTRFKDLKIAEAHALQAEQDLIEIKAAREKAEEALTELQATQKQLIQSEKMASLGELTAGIAHEIQNPLNFVNNFSDVSNELLEEMKEQLAIGNGQQAIALANDVKQNLEKINHHGRRADAIVKGMLQHSRTSSGQKEPTDINALCDEYLRLAYHGLRAKDKSFNAKFETDFDNAIGKIDIIPQEIGRAILNMINNAFYAVKEKKKLASTGLSAEQAGSALEGYEPLVVISSKKLGDDIEIRIKDNGIGIPEKILDKIFQPFFTTKPSGQGTGLGLSLAYDIITNGHSGELAFVTKEGEGTEFIIQLPYKG